MVLFKKEDVAERIGEVQKALRMNSRKFAMGANLDVSYYNKIEKGEKPLSKMYLEKIIEHYGVNEEYILTGKGPMFRPLDTNGGTIAEESKATYGGLTIKEVLDVVKNNQVLFEANKTLADANKKLADAHYLLAEGNRELIQVIKTLVEKNVSSDRNVSHIPAHEEENVSQGNAYADLVQDKTQTAGKR